MFINNNKARHQIPVIQTKIPLKDGAILGSADRGEVDLDSKINLLASGYLSHYTTVPSQCE